MKPTSDLVFLVLLLFPVAVLAIEPKTGEQILIDTPVQEDLYVAGNEVSINAKVTGDALIACSKLIVRDTITEDLTAAMGDVQLSGYVGDDVRVITGTMDINSSIGGDLIVFGGEVALREGYVIGGDLIVFSGTVDIAGTIKGDVQIYGGEVFFYGSAEGDMEVYTGSFELNGYVAGKAKLVAEHIKLGSAARIDGPVRYWTEEGSIDFGEAAPHAKYDPSLGEERESGWSGLNGLGFFIWSFLSSALLVILLIFLFGKHFEHSANRMQTAWMRSFAFGVLYIIGIPVAIFILMVSVIGIPIGLLSLAVYIFTLVSAPTLAAVVYTYCTDQYYDKGWNNWMLFLVAMGLYLLLWLIMLIPYVGWLIDTVVIGIGLGALLFRRKNTAGLEVNP